MQGRKLAQPCALTQSQSAEGQARQYAGHKHATDAIKQGQQKAVVNILP